MIPHAARHGLGKGPRLIRVLDRKPRMPVAAALPIRMARVAWAVAKKEFCRVPATDADEATGTGIGRPSFVIAPSSARE